MQVRNSGVESGLVIMKPSSSCVFRVLRVLNVSTKEVLAFLLK